MLLHRKIQSSWFVWTSGAGLKEFRNRRFSGVPSLVLIQNWRFSAAWSSCIASVVPSTTTFSCPEYDIDSRFSTLDYRFLLVQGFGNGTSTKTIAGKPFSRRRVKWWLLVRYLSDARSRRGTPHMKGVGMLVGNFELKSTKIYNSLYTKDHVSFFFPNQFSRKKFVHFFEDTE